MNKYLSRILLALALLAAQSAGSAASSILYEEYAIGTKRSEIAKIKGVYDCSKSFQEGGLCLDNQKFAGHDVGIQFSFKADQLESVILSTGFSAEFHNDVGRIFTSQYQLILIEGSGKRFDMLTEYRRHGQPEFRKRIKTFEDESLKSGKIIYYYVDKDVFKRVSSRSSNFTEFLQHSDDDVQIINYAIQKVGDVDVSLIAFHLPKIAIKTFGYQ